MTKSEQAKKLFAEGYSCAQSVFAAFSQDYDIPASTAAAMTAGFGAGIGKKQLTCGAISGAVCAIGCHFFNPSDIKNSKSATYDKTREFIDGFAAKNSSSACLDLLGVDLNTEGGAKIAKDQNLFGTKCVAYVEDACEILEKLLANSAP